MHLLCYDEFKYVLIEFLKTNETGKSHYCSRYIFILYSCWMFVCYKIFTRHPYLLILSWIISINNNNNNYTNHTNSEPWWTYISIVFSMSILNDSIRRSAPIVTCSTNFRRKLHPVGIFSKENGKSIIFFKSNMSLFVVISQIMAIKS